MFKKVIHWFRRKLFSALPTGVAGERMAEAFLAQQNYRILARNLRLPSGEVDLLCQNKDGRVIVVEVKTSEKRTSTRFRPERRVNAGKRKKLKSLAEEVKKKLPVLKDKSFRFDVIAVELNGNGPGIPAIRHHVGAF